MSWSTQVSILVPADVTVIVYSSGTREVPIKLVITNAGPDTAIMSQGGPLAVGTCKVYSAVADLTCKSAKGCTLTVHGN